MSSGSAPNRRLRHVLARAQWTQDELGRRVNQVAAESGLALFLDRRSVTHWLAGRQPRPPVPCLIAEALSRRLDRNVTTSQIGLDTHRQGSAADDAVGPPPLAPRTPHQATDETAQQDAVGLLQAMAADTHPRWAAQRIYTTALPIVPCWTDALRRSTARTPDTDIHLEPTQLSAPSLMLRMFSATDLTLGGGHARAALAAYLAVDIVPRLRAGEPGQPRAAMLSTAAQLAYLCGFMCFDDQDQGRAQRYYRVALELAMESNDHDAYAVALRAMSAQASALGHVRHAIQFAEAAAAGRTALPPLRQAFLLGQVAVAAAADGDRATAFASLAAADRHLQRATSGASYGDDEPVGRYHPAALAFQQADMQALLGDRKGAIQSLSASLRLRSSAERRARAISQARLAELHLSEGHLEQAVIAWHALLDDCPYLRSGRVTNALITMRCRLRPHAGHRVASQVLDRAAVLQMSCAKKP